MGIMGLEASKRFAFAFGLRRADEGVLAPEGFFPRRFARFQELAENPEFITGRTASRMCRVDLKMIYCWIDMRLWPLPTAVCREVFLFKRADVEHWLRTGEWSRDVFFRSRRVR